MALSANWQGSLPVPTSEEIQEDLRSAPDSDIVFTSLPEGGSREGLCERNEDVNKVVGDSIRLVQAYERLAGEHSATLPKIVNGLEKYIEELKTAVASSSDR